MNRFIGREKELNKLNKMYQSDNLEVAVIYGRRRVGKTTLINRLNNPASVSIVSGIRKPQIRF